MGRVDEDPTGLLNESFRYRDLETGAFITRDPAGFVDGPNLYTYVTANPWTYFDPQGLFKEYSQKVAISYSAKTLTSPAGVATAIAATPYIVVGGVWVASSYAAQYAEPSKLGNDDASYQQYLKDRQTKGDLKARRDYEERNEKSMSGMDNVDKNPPNNTSSHSLIENNSENQLSSSNDAATDPTESSKETKENQPPVTDGSGIKPPRLPPVAEGTNEYENEHGKNERHGDGGRKLKKSEQQLRELEGQLKNAKSRREKRQIETKINNIRKTAEKAKKGEEHSTKNKK